VSQFGKYLLVGLTNTGVGYAIIFLCMYGLQFSPVLSNFMGYGIGMGISYFLNRNFTFSGARTDTLTIARFALVSVVAYFANLLMLVFLIRTIGMHDGLSQLVAGAVYVATSFLVTKYYIFRTEGIGSEAER
jgi:putative flippase GtrA